MLMSMMVEIICWKVVEDVTFISGVFFGGGEFLHVRKAGEKGGNF